MLNSKKYFDTSIEYIINNKYKGAECQYAESNGYYLLLVDRGSEIIRFKDNGERIFFSEGIVPKEAFARYIDIYKPGFTAILIIYEVEEGYVAYLIDMFPNKKQLIYDDEKWQVLYNEETEVYYYFNTIFTADDNYCVFIELKGEEYILIEYKDIFALFN